MSLIPCWKFRMCPKQGDYVCVGIRNGGKDMWGRIYKGDCKCTFSMEVTYLFMLRTSSCLCILGITPAGLGMLGFKPGYDLLCSYTYRSNIWIYTVWQERSNLFWDKLIKVVLFNQMTRLFSSENVDKTEIQFIWNANLLPFPLYTWYIPQFYNA